MKQVTKIWWNPLSTPDFSGKVGLILAFGLVSSCCSYKTACWRPAYCWLGWWSMSFGDLLLAGLRVHELWWPQKKPFGFTSINYKIKSNDRSLPVQSFSSSCQSLARPSWSGIPDSICCRANRSLLLRRHLRPPLPRPLQGEASGLGKWRHHHRHLKKRKILNKNFHRNGLLQNK